MKWNKEKRYIQIQYKKVHLELAASGASNETRRDAPSYLLGFVLSHSHVRVYVLADISQSPCLIVRETN